MAWMYTRGPGVAVDQAKARGLYELAAQAGEFYAQIEMDDCVTPIPRKHAVDTPWHLQC